MDKNGNRLLDKLEKYVDNNKKRRKTILISLGVMVLISISLLLYKTFASFSENVSFPIMKGKVDYFGNSDVYFAFYNGNKKLEEMPQKGNEEDLVFDYGECDNGADIIWDNEAWGPMVKKLSKSKTKCSLYFKEKESIEICNKYGEDSALCYITKLGDSDYENMFYDHASANGVEDNNLRYAGLTPNNYVDIGDRDSNGNPILWQIIGVMNNIDNGSGIKESRIKIIRSESIGNYAWDSKENTNIINDWTKSALMKTLNEGAYWSKTLGKCPVKNNSTVDCDFSIKGLSDKAKSLISDVTWPLGGHNSVVGINAKQFYEKERGKKVYEENSTEWTGKVGLMYPSDYLFAVSPRLTECKDVINDNYTKFNCHKNNWLMNSSVQWTIMSENDNDHSIFRINLEYNDEDGNLWFNGSNFTNNSVRPVVYLSTNVKIANNPHPELEYGSEKNPFVIE